MSIAVGLVEFFIWVATDAPLVRELKQQGQSVWCRDEDSPNELASCLAQITESRALPSTAIQGIRSAFALTQASFTKQTALLEGLLSVANQFAKSSVLRILTACTSLLLLKTLWHTLRHGQYLPCVKMHAQARTSGNSGQ